MILDFVKALVGKISSNFEKEGCTFEVCLARFRIFSLPHSDHLPHIDQIRITNLRIEL
jgi:hypothetical protein